MLKSQWGRTPHNSHDIGIAVLDTCVPEILDEITQKLGQGMHQVVAERSILGGINLNYQISKRIMESMGLTDKDVEIIAKKLPDEIEKVKYNV